MHSVWYRANAVFTFGATTLAGICLLASLTDVVHRAQPEIYTDLVGVESLQKERTDEMYYGHPAVPEFNDRARLVVNVTADLRKDFTWNTKQIFMYIQAEFQTEKNEVNQAVLWSQIIDRQDDALVQLPRLREIYPYAVTDQGFTLRGIPLNVTVAWNVMPVVGVLYQRQRVFTGGQLGIA